VEFVESARRAFMETSKWLRYVAGVLSLITSGGAFAARGGFDPSFNGFLPLEVAMQVFCTCAA
jgi:hypothetical protein